MEEQDKNEKEKVKNCFNGYIGRYQKFCEEWARICILLNPHSKNVEWLEKNKRGHTDNEDNNRQTDPN